MSITSKAINSGLALAGGVAAYSTTHDDPELANTSLAFSSVSSAFAFVGRSEIQRAAPRAALGGVAALAAGIAIGSFPAGRHYSPTA